MPTANTAASRASTAIAVPLPRERVAAIDRLRGFIIMLVVLHHSVLAYCRFSHFNRQHYLWSSAPIVDGPGWLGFDMLVLFNDMFFMPLMFLLSGLFVWSSLNRKGGGGYLRDRALRLGLPFLVAIFVLMPIAYYPSFRMTGVDIGFASFWVQTITSGPWPSGPAWFISTLLLFDLLAIAIYRNAPRHAGAASIGPAPRPLVYFGVLVALSAIAYLPLLAIFGPVHWFAVGPFAVQASRVGLYALYFFAAVEAGRRGFNRTLLAPQGPLRQQWMRWSVVAVIMFSGIIGVQVARLTGTLTLPPTAWLAFYGVTLVLFCAAACFALLAIFLRAGQRTVGVWDNFAANSYGIYIVHYPLVIWCQYVLLDVRVSVIAKAAIVFAVALVLSWGSVIGIRRIPGVARII